MDPKPGREGLGPTPEQMREAATVSRVTTDYVLRSLATVADLVGGDMLLGIVFLALTKATLADRTATRVIYDTEQGVLPDDLRRSVSASSVAASLAMPRETVRRYIHRLQEMGLCERRPDRRFVVTSEILGRPLFREAALRNYSDTARLMTDLRIAAPLLLAQVERRSH